MRSLGAWNAGVQGGVAFETRGTGCCSRPGVGCLTHAPPVSSLIGPSSIVPPPSSKALVHDRSTVPSHAIVAQARRLEWLASSTCSVLLRPGGRSRCFFMRWSSLCPYEPHGARYMVAAWVGQARTQRAHPTQRSLSATATRTCPSRATVSVPGDGQACRHFMHPTQKRTSMLTRGSFR